MIDKSVVVVGAGAIGTAVLQHLSGSIREITVIDRDFVEEGNLSRQRLYTREDVGMPKAAAAKKHLQSIKKAVVADLDRNNADLLNADLVLDCTDNFDARFLINDYCRKNNIPWIYAAVVRNTGTVYSVLPGKACFRCIFSNHSGLETCDTAGVAYSAVAATAGLQADGALKILSSQPHETDMVRISSKLLKLKVRKNKNCPACSGSYEYLAGKKGAGVVRLCGTGTYQVKGKKIDLQLLLKNLEKSRVSVRNFGSCIHFNGMTLFSDGRAIIKANSAAQAKSVYAGNVG
ncbi:ThiF family adenylyltransferase [Candidatus Woesearchaeota archaeon]|nr:ThiF family adenylyltransferase [Candidatus Woesearchaeota archaeon]